MTYQDVDRLFGTPLLHAPKPQVPFQIKKWHFLVGGIAIVLIGYGVYALHRDIKKKFATDEKPADFFRNRGMISV